MKKEFESHNEACCSDDSCQQVDFCDCQGICTCEPIEDENDECADCCCQD